MALADRLTYLRAEREMTQRELATAASIGVVTISRIENGGYVPQAKTLQRLARALNVTVQDLVTPDELAAARARRGEAISQGKSAA